MSLPLPTHASSSLQRQLTGVGDFMGQQGPEVDSPKLKPALATVTASDISVGSGPYEIRMAGTTDPGVAGKQNQDDFYIYESADRQVIVAAVFDGHGREMGQMAAKVAKVFVREELARPEVQDRLRADPLPVLTLTFARAHKAIEDAFRKHYEELGWLVERAPEGYLTRMNKNRTGPLMCIHGGTTATVLIILDGRRVVVANVGDSTAIISGLGSTTGNLQNITDWTPMPPHIPVAAAATGAARSAGSDGSAASTAISPLPPVVPVPAEVTSSYMELSADHSPESHSEFQRMHAFRPHSTLPHHPELLFVYDTLTSSKLSCPPIFDVDSRSGKTQKTERGSYYKNVRCEWATLVATPPHAPYQDALAFTRSLGDLHLQTYGVSHTPELWWMDLLSPTGTPLVPYPLCIVVASDGIWDNWKFEEVAAYVMTPSRIAEVVRTNSAQTAAVELMATNLERGRTNFGSSADNMTAITLYLFPVPK